MDAIKVTHLGVYGILVENGALLLIKKARGPFKGLWDLPGGKLEHGETAFEGLRREFEEETKITVTSADFVEPLTNVVRFTDERGDVSMYHVGLLFKVTAFKSIKELQHEAFEDVLKAEWIPIDDINKETLSPFAQRAVELAIHA